MTTLACCKNHAATLIVFMLSIFLSAAGTAYGCTAFVVNAKDSTIIRARSMEFSMPLQDEIIAIPRGTAYTGTLPDGKAGMKWKTRYAILGFGVFRMDHIIDGVNEKGLAISAHSFSGFAEYPTFTGAGSEAGLSPLEFGTWLLSQFATVEEAIGKLNSVRIFPVTIQKLGGVIPLHYFLVDRSGRMVVIEPIAGTLKVYETPLGVMTNAPSYDWQMLNLRNYTGLRTRDSGSWKLSAEITIPEIGKGSGARGLPGDMTSPSRFIQAVFWTQGLVEPEDAAGGLSSAIGVMNRFFRTEGSSYAVVRDKPAYEITFWENFIDLKNGILYYRTRSNMDIRKIIFSNIHFPEGKILRFDIEKDAAFYRDMTSNLR